MENVMLIGIDLGKHSFHVHGQDRQGKTLLRKKFSRPQLIAFLATFHPCTIVMEACAGAHFIARQLAGFGHEAKLISPQFVRPFVKSNKNDFIDAEAICEAASRPAMRFVTPKNEAQQTLSALHRVRESLVRERVRASNQIHGFLLEFGISLPVGHAAIKRLPSVLAEQRLPARLVQVLIGPITASVLAAEVGDGKHYRCGRDFAAAVGLVPRQYSTGGKNKLLGISKRGDKNLRRLLVQCARAYMQRLERQRGQLAQWVRSMLTRRHSNVVACALANKLARMAWAIAAHHTEFEIKEAPMTT